MKKKLKFLGIETSCDETAAAVIEENDEGTAKILSSIVSSQIKEHEKFGGVVPEIAARSHVENIDYVINKALRESKISINDIIIKALGMSLSNIPDANCSWDNGEINYFGSVDISVAIAVEGGLFTPILKNVEQLNLREISNKMKDFVSRANSGKLLPKEYEGGNFSLSNLGMFGIDSFSAIINPPQSGILAIGSITKKPLVINNEIKITNCMTCKLSGDHRVIDGAVGAKLLKEFKSIIENPIKMIV